MEPKYKLAGINISSSVDYNQLSKTVEGIILTLSSVIIMVASIKGVVILPEQIQAFAANAATTVSAFGVMIGAITALAGAIRKFLVMCSTN